MDMVHLHCIALIPQPFLSCTLLVHPILLAHFHYSCNLFLSLICITRAPCSPPSSTLLRMHPNLTFSLCFTIPYFFFFFAQHHVLSLLLLSPWLYRCLTQARWRHGYARHRANQARRVVCAPSPARRVLLSPQAALLLLALHVLPPRHAYHQTESLAALRILPASDGSARPQQQGHDVRWDGVE